MSPEGAIAWLNQIRKTLDIHSETSKIIAIDKGIEAIKSLRSLERENRNTEEFSDIIGEDLANLD